jgi:protein-tyrosine sulfotransferase
MVGQSLKDALSFVRLRQLPRYARRAIGLPTARAEDFLFDLRPGEGERLRAIAESIRGPSPSPAIFVHGVLPRSGTNFVSDALALHPAVHAFPGRLWEFPLLYLAPGAAALQRELCFMFQRNREVMGRFDLLAYLASGWLLNLQAEAGARRILLKSPHVQGLSLFPHIFPHDILVLCLRDGRDVIQSSLGTFERLRLRTKRFRGLASEWRHGTEAILTFEPGGANANRNAAVVRYETLVRDPAAEGRKLLEHARLDPEAYDFEALSRLPVRGSSALASPGAARWEPHQKPQDFQPIGRWHAVWSKSQKNRFKAVAGATLIRAGYAADDHW